VNDLKNELQNNPIIVRMLVPNEFHGYQGGIFNHSGGEIPDSCGHAVLLVGYNDDQQCFKAKNSWGREWGEDGYFRISYDDVTDYVKFGHLVLKGNDVYTEWFGFNVENLGEGDLILNSIESDKSWITISPEVPPGLSIAPGEDRGITMIIDWDKVSGDQEVATISFNSNDPDESCITRSVIVKRQTNGEFDENFDSIDNWITKVYQGTGSFSSGRYDGENVATFYMSGEPGVVFTYRLLSNTIPVGTIIQVRWFYQTSGAYTNSENSDGGKLLFMKEITQNEPGDDNVITLLFSSRDFPMRQWNEEEFLITKEIPAGSYIAIGGSVWPSHIINHWDYIKLVEPNDIFEKQDTYGKEYSIYQNYPNPFNPITTINYEIPKTSQVTLTIYDVNGHVVDILVNKKQEPGFYSVNWDAMNVSTGIYFYQLKTDGFQQVTKMLLIK